MVMLSGMLIVILGIGMLFFYQKQVERRMKLEFDIHRRLAAKSGFNLAQYIPDNNTNTYFYSYITAANRPDILVTVGAAEPIYEEDFHSLSNWVARTDGGGTVTNIGGVNGEFRFSTGSTNIAQRNELVFAGAADVAWANYPFGLCYAMWIYDTTKNWAGYVYVGSSNDWNDLFLTNAVALLTVYGEPGTARRLELYEHTVNTVGSATNNSPSAVKNAGTDMGTETELYLDRAYMAIGLQISSTEFIYTGATNLPAGFSGESNVVMGVGGFNQAVATNDTLVLNKFEVRNPYEYEIYLSWTNRNRYFGTTNTMYTTNVLATVVDKTALGNDYYFFDSFETVVP